PVGHLVGIPADRSVGSLVEAVGALAGRAARVRAKIEPGWDAEPVRALRAAFPELALQVDANGSYRMGGGGLDDADRLVALDGAGLVCIEQPLPAGDLQALAVLAGRLETPVCLDETLTTVRRLRDALRQGACEVACIKPARFGGLLGAQAAAQLCASAGVPAFVGGFFETGYARRANAALALLDGFSLPGDLSDPREYLTEDSLFEGTAGAYDGVVVRPYDGPGVAPAPRLQGVAPRCSVSVGPRGR
ncbi:MAG: enolase C-terminal domain-like protein, partial [Acidimicrobiales bacterium]